MKTENRVWVGATPEQIEQDLQPFFDFNADGMPLEQLENLMPRPTQYLLRFGHPGLAGFFNTVPDDGGRLGAQILRDYNPSVTNFFVSPGGAIFEEMALAKLV